MLNTPRSRWIAFGSLGALLLAAGTTVALAGDGQGRRGGKHRRAREAVVAREFGKIVKDRRRKMFAAMERIDSLSDEQARAALDASRDLGRIREEVRARTAALLVQAFREAKASPDRREAIREATRAKVRALREEYRAPFTEAGMKVVRTLTPEQKAKIEEKGKARGKAITDEEVARFLGMRLARPWAEALLKARVEGGATVPANK